MADIANLGNYSPEDVVMILNSLPNCPKPFSHVVSGTAEGTFITFERGVDRATLQMGSDLTAGRVLRRNKSGTITLSLNSYAETNDFLSELARLDEESHNSDYIFSVTIKDMTGRSVFYAPQAFLGNDPSMSFSTDGDTRDWTITVVNAQRHIGGSSLLAPDNVTTLEDFGYVVEDRWKTNTNTQTQP